MENKKVKCSDCKICEISSKKVSDKTCSECNKVFCKSCRDIVKCDICEKIFCDSFSGCFYEHDNKRKCQKCCGEKDLKECENCYKKYCYGCENSHEYNIKSCTSCGYYFCKSERCMRIIKYCYICRDDLCTRCHEKYHGNFPKHSEGKFCKI
jgi:hypothetical protein